MCGRFTIALDQVTFMQIIAGEYDLTSTLENAELPRYNIAPTQRLPVYAEGALSLMRFGFTSSHAKAIINARGETINHKSLFKDAFKSRRALVFADGFYEWKTTPYGKEAYRITLPRKPLFAMAALIQPNTTKNGDNDNTFVIVTTKANRSMQHIHNRMPVILDRDAAHEWLNPTTESTDLKALLVPYPSEALKIVTVSPRVNRVDVDDASLIKPIAPTPSLF